MATNSRPRVLFYDLETSLMPVAVFALQHNDYINHEAILSERYIISASWCWGDESKIHSVSVLDDPKRYRKDPHDDRHVVEVLHEVLSEADVVVGHNSDSFDNRYVNTRVLAHGLPALPPYTSVDTYKIAKAKFYLNSNKLDYIAKLLKVGKKIQTTPGLWMRVLAGEAAAVKEMVAYNKHDVVILREVFRKLLPYAQNMPNLALYGKGEGCPKCGSGKIQSRGLHRAISRVYRRFQCQSCSSWFRAAVNEKDVKCTTKVL